MKRYRKFMDGVKAPDTLRQRLKELKTPKKQPAAWAKYGAVAAAFILVFGGAALGMHWDARWSGRLDGLFRQAVYVPENVDEPQPDLAIEDPSAASKPGEKVLEGYDVQEERGGVSVVCHYCLPYIDYGTSNENAEQKIAMDWAIQEGAVERELTQEEIIDLLGGQDVVSVHLDWDSYELSGRIWERPDSSILMVLLGGYQGPLDHFEFSMMDGELPPTCIAHENSVTQEVQGLIVTADKYDGEQGCDRRVSFMKGDIGYRFDLTSTDAQRAEVLVSRLVRQAAEGSLCAAGEAEAAPVISYTCPDCGRAFSAYDSFRAHVHSFPGGDATAPAVSADPSYSAPAVSAEPSDSPRDRGENWCGTQGADIETCPNCGAVYPVGSEHECELCGDPPPHTCEICGEVYMEGTAHSHEICGYPLAPDAQVCEVCGQTIPVGVEHSHQEDHHGSHH